MKLLILSFYYPPDLSAGSFRTAALVEALQAQRPEGLQIDVITTQPNRYHSVSDQAAEIEDHGGLKIRRLPLPPHRSGALDQARAFTAFLRGALPEVREGEWDAVFATSSRLMTAALGAEVARRKGAPLYLDIRDLFADTMSDLLSNSPLKVLLPVFRWLEARTFRAADRINLVSAGFLDHARAVAPGHDYRVFTNGIDEAFLTGNFTSEVAAGEAGAPLVLYAGNIGDGQGLHRILPDIATRMTDRVRFRVVGDGGRRRQLESALGERALANIDLQDPVPRSELNRHYRDAGILFLHLNDHAAFRKVLPSKIFEYAATGKPILAGVAGHAADFLMREAPGVAVFAPCDVDGMERGLEQLLAGPKRIDRSAFLQTYARRTIMARMAADLIDLAENP